MIKLQRPTLKEAIAASLTAIWAIAVAYNPNAAGATAKPVRSNSPMTVDTFRHNIVERSQNNLTIVLLRKTDCARCDLQAEMFADVKYEANTRAFTFYQIDRQKNPEIDRLLHQRDSDADGRLHMFFNGKKIYESTDMVTGPNILQDYVLMADELAHGRVSILDLYQDPNLKAAP